MGDEKWLVYAVKVWLCYGSNVNFMCFPAVCRIPSGETYKTELEAASVIPLSKLTSRRTVPILPLISSLNYFFNKKVLQNKRLLFFSLGNWKRTCTIANTRESTKKILNSSTASLFYCDACLRNVSTFCSVLFASCLKQIVIFKSL